MGIESKDRRARIGFGIANLVVAAAVLAGVFRLLPTRWWVVDLGAVVISLLLASSGIALLRKLAIAETLTRIASAIVLALGLALVTAIFATAGWISGVYGQVGAGGAVIFGLVGALVLPYVVVFPAVELAWIGPRKAPPKVVTPPPAPPKNTKTERAPKSSKRKATRGEDAG